MKRLIIAASAIVALVGCQKGNNNTPTGIGTNPIDFSSQIATRVDGTQWESGDVVGIMVTKENELVSNYKYNAKHNVDISSSTVVCGFTPQSKEHTLYWPSDSTQTIHFYGYYPYSSVLSIDDQSYPINVADQSSLSALDFMEASTRKTYPMGYSQSSHATVALEFERRMAKLTFSLNAGDGMELEDITSVTLKGFNTTAVYDFNTNKFTQVSAPADITAHRNSETSYSAIVIPTMDGEKVYTPTAHTIVFSTANGDFEWDITNVELNAGAHRLYNVTLDLHPLVSGGNEINGWDTENGGSLEFN